LKRLFINALERSTQRVTSFIEYMCTYITFFIPR